MSDVDELAKKLIHFVDRNGKVLTKRSDPFAAGFSAEYAEGKTKIKVNVMQSPFSNGSAWVKVSSNKRTVFEANASMIGRFGKFNCKKYKPGAWEKVVEDFVI